MPSNAAYIPLHTGPAASPAVSPRRIGQQAKFTFMSGHSEAGSKWKLFARVCALILSVALIVNLVVSLVGGDGEAEPVDGGENEQVQHGGEEVHVQSSGVAVGSAPNALVPPPRTNDMVPNGNPVAVIPPPAQTLPTMDDEAKRELDTIQAMDRAVVRNRTFHWDKYTWPEDKEHSVLAKDSDKWYDVVEGQVRHPNGMVFNIYNDICFSVKSFHVVARDENHYQELDYCCFQQLNRTKLYNCSSVVLKQCDILGSRPMIKGFTLWRRSDVTTMNLPVLEGNAYWMYTVGRVEHIGHMVNRMLQFFHVSQGQHMPKIDFFFAQRASRPRGEHLRTMVDTVLAPYMEKSWWHDTMLRQITPTVCLRRIYELDIGQGENLFFTKEQGNKWRQFSKAHFLPKNFNDSFCPPPIAVVLRRDEGSGMRKILNYDVIDRVLKKNGIRKYVNVTIGAMNDTREHVDAFSGFGLMVSSHSSQLKNLIFTRRNAAVVECRGTPPGYMQPSPFSSGMDKLDIIFEESVGHKPDLSSCPESHGCVEFKRYKTDYWLDEAIFDQSIKNALAKQAAAGCGDIWKNQ